MTQQSRWQTDETAAAYLEGVRGAIPGVELQLEVVETVLRALAPKAARILDLGCGDGFLGRTLIERFPDVHVLFADFSPPMLNAVKEKLGDTNQADIVTADFSSDAWTSSVQSHAPFDVVVSGFAIHHQPDERKREIYTEIHGQLAPGGVFLNIEHVASPTPEIESCFNEHFIDHLCRYHTTIEPGRTRQDIANTYYNRPDKNENILAPVEEQCGWLRDLGYEQVDCFYKAFEIAIFGGRKPNA